MTEEVISQIADIISETLQTEEFQKWYQTRLLVFKNGSEKEIEKVFGTRSKLIAGVLLKQDIYRLFNI